MMDEQAFRNAARYQAEGFREQLDYDIGAALKTADIQAVWKMVDRLATLTPGELEVLKLQFKKKFGKDFQTSIFNNELKLERAKLKIATPPPVSTHTNRTVPDIQINGRSMNETTAHSLDALRAANNPPTLFVRSGKMVQVHVDERQRPGMRDVSQDALRGRMDRAANYVRVGEDRSTPAPAPIDSVRDILAMPCVEWGLPPLDVVVEVPTLRTDGTVLDTPGYDAGSRMLYMPDPKLTIKPIPSDPSGDEVQESLDLIMEAIGDFPFAEDGASLANFLGLLFTPIVRPAITGCTPLAIIDAPQAGTGKSLLVDVFSIITTGRPAAMMPFPRQEEEVQKSISSTLLQGRSLVCFDNLEGVLQSPTLALVLTAKEYESRILGVTQNMVAPNRATWVVTGNNVKPGGDMPRRCYHIRLDAKSSRPYTGRTYRHNNLLEWVGSNRANILRALLMVARAWFFRGKPTAVPDPLGSFEAWHKTIGGILKCAGVPGFMSNMSEWIKEDEIAIQWERFLQQLSEAFPNKEEFVAATIAQEIRGATPMLPARFTLPDEFGSIDRRKEGMLERVMGQKFRNRVGARYGVEQYHLEREYDGHTKINSWRVEKG